MGWCSPLQPPQTGRHSRQMHTCESEQHQTAAWSGSLCTSRTCGCRSPLRPAGVRRNDATCLCTCPIFRAMPKGIRVPRAVACTWPASSAHIAVAQKGGPALASHATALERRGADAGHRAPDPHASEGGADEERPVTELPICTLTREEQPCSANALMPPSTTAQSPPGSGSPCGKQHTRFREPQAQCPPVAGQQTQASAPKAFAFSCMQGASTRAHSPGSTVLWHVGAKVFWHDDLDVEPHKQRRFASCGAASAASAATAASRVVPSMARGSGRGQGAATGRG